MIKHGGESEIEFTRRVAERKLLVKWGSISGAVVFAIILFFSTVFTIQEGTVGVKSTFGEYSEVELTAGIQFKLPIIQAVQIKDIKMQTVNYTGAHRVEDLDVHDGVSQRSRISILDNKNLPLGFELSIQFTPKAEEMSYILATYGHNYFDKKINPIIRDTVRDVASGYLAETVSQKRTEIGNKLKDELTLAFKELPFILNEAALRDIKLPDVIKAKVIAVQEAKQEEQRLDMVEKQAIVTKKIDIINAEKAAAVKVLDAAAIAESVELIAQGRAKAILIQSAAKAKGNKLVSASLSDKLIRQNWVQQWKGQVPTHILGSEANLLLGVK